MSNTSTLDHKQVRDFKDGVQRMGERAGEVKENLSGLAHDAASTVHPGTHEAADGVKRTVDASRKTAAKAVEGLSDRISQSPLTTIGIALGVGVVIGLVVRRSRGSTGA